MPIFMDRHDVSETVTAEIVAQIHQEDLKIQHLFGCRGLTYWFDDKRKTAFCLIEAPDKKAIRDMHDQAHGQVPHSVIEVDPAVVESFLGRIEDPEKSQNTELNIISDPAFRTILVISLHHPLLSREQSEQLEIPLRDFNALVQKTVKNEEGTLVTQTDFYYLASFRSVSQAVRASLDIKSRKNFSQQKTKDTIELKMGLSAGVPVTKMQLIFEDTIKLSERMCEIINGELMISAEVMDLYKNENARSFSDNKGIVTLTQPDEKFITLLMDYMDAHWNDANMNVDLFSRELGYSKSQFYRKLVLLTGKAPNIFIREYRLKQALKLLKKGIGNISEIAFQTGFSSPSYFSKCFQKRYGYLPSGHLLFAQE